MRARASKKGPAAPALTEAAFKQYLGLTSAKPGQNDSPLELTAERCLLAIQQMCGGSKPSLTFGRQGPFVDNVDGISTQWEGGYILNLNPNEEFKGPRNLELKECLEAAFRSVIPATGALAHDPKSEALDPKYIYLTSKGVLIGEGDMDRLAQVLSDHSNGSTFETFTAAFEAALRERQQARALG